MLQQRTVIIGLVQMRCDGSPADNLSKACDHVGQAARQGAQVIALPELFCSRYFCQRPDDASAFALAEEIPGPTAHRLADVARKHGIVLVGGSVFEKTRDGTYYNTAPVFGPDGRLLGSY